jgi:hypothetical protein
MHPSQDLFKSLQLDKVLQKFTSQRNRLKDIQGNHQIRYKTCLQDILFGPEHLPLAIEPFDSKVFEQALDIKAGPIAGFDSSIVFPPMPKEKEENLTTAKKATPSNSSLKRVKKIEEAPKAKRIIPQTITHF